MQRKVFLQFFLLSVITVIIFFFYRVYFINDKSNISVEKIIDKDKEIFESNQSSNVISDIEYIATDSKGSSYLIKSKIGEINSTQSNLINLKQVTAIINFENSSPVKISSDKALYDNVNYDTEFEGNVIVSYINHTITSDNLNLYFKKDIADIFNNVVYKNLNTTLQADKIEIDLLTKNSNIYMDNSFQKIKVINKK